MNAQEKDNNPLVSVAVTTFNYGNYIADAIASVLAQTYKNLEIIIRDDCSPPPDKTSEIIAGFKDSRIKFTKNSKNIGLFVNLNTVLRECKGEYIKILCADDRLKPTCIEEMVNASQSFPEAGQVFSNYCAIDGNGKLMALVKKNIGRNSSTFEPLYFTGKESQKIFYFHGCVWGNLSSGMIKRDILQTVGFFPENSFQTGDFEYLIKISNKFGMVYVPKPLVEIRWHESSASSRNANAGKSISEFYELMELFPVLAKGFKVSRINEFIQKGKIDENFFWETLLALLRKRRTDIAKEILSQILKYGSIFRGIVFFIIRFPRRLMRLILKLYLKSSGKPWIYYGES
ncbi:MAG: glycosyltransferase [Candidatus Schekmanbacteria bacterium]|nr:glycosyltransferase [Candidatus Schekmanbacteria bacterium]